jgi:hypothetical protein
VNVRLAAVDLSGLGPKVIIPEFALAVLSGPALGVLTVVRSRSLGMTALGVDIGLGVNYVPLLIHATDLVRRSAVAAAIIDEAFDRRSLSRNNEGSRYGCSSRSWSA